MADSRCPQHPPGQPRRSRHTGAAGREPSGLYLRPCGPSTLPGRHATSPADRPLMPGDPDLPAQAWDDPPSQAARVVSGVAHDAARAWTQPLPAAAILDVTWDLHRTFRDLGIALWRLSRFQHDAEPEMQPDDQQHGPGSRFYRAGGAPISADAVLRDSEVLQHVRRTITLGLPVGGRPGQGARNRRGAGAGGRERAMGHLRCRPPSVRGCSCSGAGCRRGVTGCLLLRVV